MRKADAVLHFGSQAAIARALNISAAAVAKWDEVVPEGSAYKLESVTGGELKVDASLYAKPARHELRQSA